MQLLWLLLVAQLGRDSLPPPRGYVNDFAGVLDAASVSHMEAVIAEVRAKSRGEIAVVTLPDIGDRAASDVALQIGREWGVGAKGEAGDPAKNLGVVVLLVPRKNHRPGSGKVFIATGRGAEGFLPDARAGLIHDTMTPYFASERYSDGLELGGRVRRLWWWRRLQRRRRRREFLTMAKPISVDDFAKRLEAALGGRLVSLLLYGSAARGTHVAGRSDVNTLLVCDAADESLFAALGPVLRDWLRGGHPAPLILTAAEWRGSADVFPIEYEDIRAAHRVLAGRDPWPGITVRRDDARRQLEQELKGKLLRLRQAYAAHRGDGKRLGELVAASAGGFFTMLRAALRLAGRPAPAAPDALLRESAATMGFPADGVAQLGEQVRGASAPAVAPRDPRVAQYLQAVARAAQFVNGL